MIITITITITIIIHIIGISTYEDLVEDFEYVKSEVKKASLMPNETNGSFLRHQYATFLSKLLSDATFDKISIDTFKNPVNCSQQEKILYTLGRAEYYLKRKDIYNATVQLNLLERWSKLAANQWLINARTYLETLQAIDIISAVAKDE